MGSNRNWGYSGYDGAGFHHAAGDAGLGRLSDEAQHGMYLHPTWVVTPEGVALGVIDAWGRWNSCYRMRPDGRRDGYGKPSIARP